MDGRCLQPGTFSAVDDMRLHLYPPPQLSEISWLFCLAIQNDDKKLSKLVGVRVENWMKMIINFDQSNGNGAC